ncbi:hypothetical protein SCHPADRAFT_875665 [Schizopora paradoxa]|uniref:Hyaluronan-mediated motility receptor C-terminal domain-containing protein n=1 Tax=Schizopora paradoxa TaxID=27342 RepID=A0A0H2RS13_9AGAM|nr:hypothetical protein SCHPADRAFT_875665 [Schizopora paradoxa]
MAGTLRQHEGRLKHERDDQTLSLKYESLKSKYLKLQKENEKLRTSDAPAANEGTDSSAKLTYLRRKLEDLEQVHKEGKAKHHAELSAVRSELDRYRKISNEQSDQLARMKQQHEASEVRLQDMKKAVSADQAEVRGLKLKLKQLEQERDKLSGKHTDAASLRRALNAAESKGKTELQTRDRQLGDTQKTLADERKKVSSLQEKVRSIMAKAEEDCRQCESREKELKTRLKDAEGRAKDADIRYAALEESNASNASNSRMEISQLKTLVSVVTEQYAELASSTIPKGEYEQLRLQAIESRFSVLRLERKLGNVNDMVESLASLSRQLQMDNELLSAELRDANDTVQWLLSTSQTESMETIPESLTLSYDHDKTELAFYKSLEEAHSAILRNILDISHMQAEKMLSCIRVTVHDLAAAEDLISETKEEVGSAQQENVRLSGLVEASRKEIASLSQLVAQKSNEVSALEKTVKGKEGELMDNEKRSRSELCKRDELLAREREVTSRLQSTVQKCKMAEDALRAEIDQLSNGIADADIYREAYESIAEEMRNLVARNTLAEEEAERLSKFNAEILGHRNPVQKICYVDKIRRELAETKQKLLVSTRETEVASDERNALKNELCLYKSVAVPFDGKPKSNLTRVRRIPLTALSENSKKESPSAIDMRKYVPDGDMTIDELH